MSMLSDLMSKHAAGTSQIHRALVNQVRAGAGLPPGPEPVVDETQLTELHNFTAMRQRMVDRALQAVKEGLPVSNATHELSVRDLKPDNKSYSTADVKRAILEGRTLATKISGIYELRNKATGELLAKTGRKTIINVPYLTGKGVYIRNGTAYTLTNQLRLRPGVYHLTTADGFPEAQFNAKQGTGGGFRTWFDPESSVFYLTVQNKKVPLYPVLKAMGVEDGKMQAAWGKEIHAKNAGMKISASATKWLNQMQEPAEEVGKDDATSEFEVPDHAVGSEEPDANEVA